MELDEEYTNAKIRCSHCPRKFKHIFEMDRHLEADHGFDTNMRERIYIDMGIKWFQNYSPPGIWKGWWLE